jgi:hypothetical protein
VFYWQHYFERQRRNTSNASSNSTKSRTTANTIIVQTSGEMVQLQPLTVDVETEKRLLEEQRRAREKAVAEQEARAAEFLATTTG